ncbi:MAG TPA: cytochrome c [Bryobacteraceae bacterium]|nr:cytochrome c [Bryobacteraceae bacterium]
MTRLNVFLLAVFLFLAGANWLVEPDPARPNYEYLPEMVRSPAYESFSLNEHFPDGITLQPPVPGTLPRGLTHLPYAGTAGEAVRAGRELTNPLSLKDPRVLERGAFLYSTYCMPCHGAGGAGDGPVALRGYPAPPNLLTGKATQYPDGQLFHIVSYGQKNMPGYAAQLTQADRWKVILYVRALQQEAAQKAVTAAVELKKP